MSTLDHFGEILMKEVRDEAIEQWEMLIDGRLKGATAEACRPGILAMTPDDRATLAALIPRIVDTTIHHLLWTLERREDVSVAVRAGGSGVPSIAAESDGLAGEVYGPDGWQARFSKYPEQ
jgi:hypothetical protein